MASTKKSITKPSTGKSGRSRTAASSKNGSKKPATKGKSASGATIKSGQKQTASIDRRGGTERRTTPEQRCKNEPIAVERRSVERRKKVNRRRQIDPTTCERDYTPAEVEFMNALDDYKRTSGRMFPTCSEVLEVLVGLGYVKCTCAESVATTTETPTAASGE